jgi:hypothetical protein
MGAASWQAGAQGQHLGGPVQRLDLAFLVDADDDRVVGRGEVQADDVADFRLELRVGRELERLDPVRLDAPFPPDPGDRRERDPQLGGQEPCRPVRDPQPLRRAPVSVATTTSASSISAGRPERGSSSRPAMPPRR